MNQKVQKISDNSQGERIRLERQRLNLTQSQIADSVGVGKTTVINWEKEEGTSPNSVHLAKLLHLGFNIFYILTGQREETESAKAVEDNSDFALIPFYEAEISAGLGRNNDTHIPSKHLAFRKDWLRAKRLSAKALVAATATGDSMGETVPNGCTMLIDTSQNNPRDGSIYVIRSSDIFWVKRIQRQLDGSLLLISDNETYPPMTLDLRINEDVQIIGQVVYISKDVH